MRPVDPFGPVSLVSLDSPMAKWAEALGLTVVGAVLGTIIIGNRLPDVGIFAAALGLAALSLRGGTTTELLADHISADGSGTRLLALWALLESWAWFFVIVAAALASRWAAVWCFGADHESCRLGALSERERIRGDVVDGAEESSRSFLRYGLTHSLMTTVVAVLLIRFFVAGDSAGWVRQGQAVFATIVGCYVGSRFAFHYAPVRTSFWSLASIPLICLVAFGWVMLRGRPERPIFDLESVPSSGFFRILPLTYVAVAAATIVYASWAHRRDVVTASDIAHRANGQGGAL
jgi:hypothetical protein